MKRLHPALKVISALALLLCLAGVSFVLFLQSDWVTHRLRQAVIDGVEEATGARTEIPNFRWNWRALTVEMRGFTMHGFEAPSGPPLFTAPLVQVRIRILSLLEQTVQVSSLVVTRPRFNLTVGTNGYTNIPGPKHPKSPRQIIEGLLNLKLPHVEAKEGLAQINDRRFPVNLVGDHVAVLIEYRRPTRRYHLVLQSPALRLGGTGSSYFDGAVEASGDLWRDHFSLTTSHFHSRSADLRITGLLSEFNNPVVDWRLTSSFATTENLRRFGIQGLTGGTILLSGIGHHDPQIPIFFDGKLAADHLALSVPGLQLREGSVRSRILADAGSLQLSDLLVAAPEAHFAGRAKLTSYRDLQLSGNLSRASLQTVASLFLHRALPWSGTLGGPLELSANLQPVFGNAVVHAAFTIEPRPEGIPLGGDLSFLYRQRESDFAIQTSHLRLPNTVLAFSGQPDKDVAFTLDSTNLNDLRPALLFFGGRVQNIEVPSIARTGNAHLQGVAHLASGTAPHVEAALDLSHMQWKRFALNRLQSTLTLTPSQLHVSSLVLDAPLVRGSATADVALSAWQPGPASAIQTSGNFSHANLQSLVPLVNPQLAAQFSGGSAEGTFGLHGTLADPAGTAQISLADLTVRGEHLDSATATFSLATNQVTASKGQVRSGNAALTFSGSYLHTGEQWDRGTLQLALDTNRFPLSRLLPLTPALQNLEGQSELHAKTSWTLAPQHIAPLDLSGTASLRNMLWRGVPVGDLLTTASTQGRTIQGALSGNLRGSKISGNTQVQIAAGTPAKGVISFDAITLETLTALLQSRPSKASVLTGSAVGDLHFDGPLEAPSKLHALLALRDVQVNGPPLRSLGEELVGAPVTSPAASEVILHNAAPVTLELTGGVVTVSSFQLTGRDTQLAVTGSAGLLGAQPLHLALDGGVDLRLLQLLSPDLRSGGRSIIAATATGTLTDPQLSGVVKLTNASAFSSLLPNGLSDLEGTIRLDQHRATLEKVTAHSGGGSVTFGGFITYSANHPLVYRLESSGQNVRVRYANGISITGNSEFSLTGTSDQSLLSGGITVSRVVFNPSTDVGNLLALTGAPSTSVDNGKDYLSHLQMDIHVESAPNLQLDTALSSGVQAEIDLQLRGTPKQPIFLGSIEANEGDIRVFGSRYSINRGQVSFTNSARLEPILDLDLQTQARGITVDITVSGTLSKLNINYRSDPPLQPREIIALLTVGRTPQTTATESNVQATNDANSLQSGANTVLGQAISPVSNRLSKLFGITNIKIDPLVQGITNTPQARLTLEQQISRQINVTYITNLSQTSEQIFRLEYSLNPQFSLVALRDDNGEFGVDILYKKRFK